MTRSLKDSKKQVWPLFPLHCGIYTLHDFKHAEKEAEKTKDLSLAVIPKRQYDPNKVAYNFTSQVKMRKFIHEKDEYDDLFASADLFSQVTHLEIFKLGATKMDKFTEYRTWRLQTLPLDLLNTTPTVQQVEHNVEHTIEEIYREGETIEKTSEPLSIDVNIDPILIKEWEKFDQ